MKQPELITPRRCYRHTWLPLFGPAAIHWLNKWAGLPSHYPYARYRQCPCEAIGLASLDGTKARRLPAHEIKAYGVLELIQDWREKGEIT